MTLKQADEAAQKAVPIKDKENNIVYRFIREIGYRYEDGKKVPFVGVVDMKYNFFYLRPEVVEEI